jgi:hypothetical protein
MLQLLLLAWAAPPDSTGGILGARMLAAAPPLARALGSSVRECLSAASPVLREEATLVRQQLRLSVELLFDSARADAH